MTFRPLSTLAAAAALTACGAAGGGRPADPEFDDAAPEFEALSLELTGDAEAEGRAAGQPLEGDVPEFLRNARDAVRNLNHAVLAVLSPIADLIAENPDVRTGTRHVWGPKEIGNATYRFTIVKAAPNRYGWKGEVKAPGAGDDAYRAVMGGVFVKGAERRRGAGKAGFDLDALGAIDTAVKARGKLLVGFAHAAGGAKALTYALRRFTPDSSAHPAIDAAFVGWRGPAGATQVRLLARANVPGSPNAETQEITAMRIRWIPTLGGRADAVAWDGDVPENHAYVGNACWNVQKAQGFLAVRDCVRTELGGSCTVVKTEGKLENCALGLRSEALPEGDPAATDAEEGAPATHEEPPPEIPDGSGNL